MPDRDAKMQPNLRYESDFLFGVHEPGGEELMLAAGKPGWIVFTEAVGHDPEDTSGLDFTTFANDGLGVICRINHGYEPEGTLPHSSLYEAFARRVANFVDTSQGCHVWVIGNEMNYAVERPGIVIDWSRHQSNRTGPPEIADPMRRGLAVRFNVLPDHSTEIRTTRGAIVSPGEVITPEMYARAYRLCREAIHRLPGHEKDRVLVGAVCPWNTQTIYPGNPNGDWILYFRHILEQLGPENCDGYALHASTHGPDPALLSSSQRLPPPFQGYHEEFRVFTDFMAAVPAAMKHLPGFITEMDQTQPWADRNEGWVQRAYAEIEAWNHAQEIGGSPQRVRCAALYRWPRVDKWFIEGKLGVIDDFETALQADYRWRREEPLEEVAEASAQPASQSARAPAAAAPSVETTATDVSNAPATNKGKRKNNRKRKEEPVRPRYRIEWVDDAFPPKLTVGQVISVPITLRNTGALTWRWSGGNPFRLGYRYYRNRKLIETDTERDLRTDIPQDVPPGQEITLAARIATPTDPGNYTLEMDLIHEGITWFKEQDSPVLTRWLTIEPAKPASHSAGSGNGARLPDHQEPTLNLPVPLFTDVIARLPRSSSPYARRSLNQIKHLVISSTGANPRLSLERIASAHVAAGYPGIAYGFVVDASGQVFRTSELENVAQPDQRWSEQGVNIALAGNFTGSIPGLPQLDATGRLCSWLAQNLGLSPESIVGLGELTQSDNPGPAFYRGPTWKEMIQRQVQLHMAALGMGAADAERAHEAIVTATRLETETRALKLQLEDALRAQESTQVENIDLRSRVMEMQQQLNVLSEGGVRQPRTINAINDMPREAHRYRKRSAEQVQLVVISHTGAPANTPLALLAQEHRRDWPGMLFDFVIDPLGNITQTQPLDEAVASDEIYLSAAINVALAGDFEEAVPSRAQINAAGALIAWLLDRYPQLTLESIKGMRELTRTNSPGRTWEDGKRWRDDLMAAVRRAGGAATTVRDDSKWRERIADLEVRLEQATRAQTVLQDVRSRLESETQRLQTELNLSKQASGFVIPKPPLNSIVDQLPRHPTLRYERRSLSQITHIAVHHTAAPASLGPLRIAELHIQADTARGKESWPGIGYHFFIHADGNIEQTQPLESVCFHVFRHNQYSVGIVFAGSFMNGKIPTSAQLRSGAHLLAWLMQELNVPLARIWGHREFPENITVCPGSEWNQGNRWRDLLFERIEQVQGGQGVKSVRHYMLFWQRPYPGPVAQNDLQGALAYINRFRPTVGFSVEDARNAEYVTIVGGEAGVSLQVDRELEEHGSRVERIAGGSEEETAHLLADMAQSGRRFVKYDVDF
jgi:N-acetyl-anhydromuramyl-L-alanine amidase AmpD